MLDGCIPPPLPSPYPYPLFPLCLGSFHGYHCYHFLGFDCIFKALSLYDTIFGSRYHKRSLCLYIYTLYWTRLILVFSLAFYPLLSRMTPYHFPPSNQIYVTVLKLRVIPFRHGCIYGNTL